MGWTYDDELTVFDGDLTASASLVCGAITITRAGITLTPGADVTDEARRFVEACQRAWFPPVSDAAGLREALEEAVCSCHADYMRATNAHHPDCPVWAVRRVLAAHPAPTADRVKEVLDTLKERTPSLSDDERARLRTFIEQDAAPPVTVTDEDALAKEITRHFFDLIRDDAPRAAIAAAGRASAHAVLSAALTEEKPPTTNDDYDGVWSLDQ